MLNYMLKSYPGKFIFGGYSVRKSFTIMTSNIGGKMVYDSFLYTYIDNYITFYILMDNGKYKNMETGEEVPSLKAEDIMSKHLARGVKIDSTSYEEYEKDKIIGVFGLRNLEDIMKQTDKMNEVNDNEDIKLTGFIDVKKSYMGMEISGAINGFNRALNRNKEIIQVPPIKNSMDDPYNSLIGDEIDFFDFMSNKTSDQIINDLVKLDSSIDGVNQVKEGKKVTITKGTENTRGSVIIEDVKKEE